MACKFTGPWNPGGPNGGPSEVVVRKLNIPKYKPSDLYYDMSGDRILVVFNHVTFMKDSPHYLGTPPPERQSSIKDVERLEKTLGKRGFNIYRRYDDSTHSEILERVRKICNMDHIGTSCVTIVILTHGGGGGMLCAADKMYPMSDVLNLVLLQPGLAGKPKMFFVQGTLMSPASQYCEISVVFAPHAGAT